MKAKKRRKYGFVAMAFLAVSFLMYGCGDTGKNQKPEMTENDASPRRTAMSISSETNQWTTGIIDAPNFLEKPAVIKDVRIGEHVDWDRIVFEFEGDQFPGYHLEYIDSPIRRCGSGEVVWMDGPGWLQIHLYPAQTRGGDAPGADRQKSPGLPVLEEAVLVCDAEGAVEWVLGLKETNRYRVLELTDPARLVVDVLH